MSAGKMLHTGNFLCTDFKKLEGTLPQTMSDVQNYLNCICACLTG